MPNNLKTKTQELLKRLQRVECPDTTFFAEGFPIVMKQGQGMWVRDIDGNRYLDFTSCFGVLALGHRHRVTLNALRKQSARLIHGMGDVHPSLAKIEFLELLAKLVPFDTGKALLGQSGGDAIEAALKTAILYTGKRHFISFAGGYHGLQFAPLSLSNRPIFTRGFEDWLQGQNTVLPFPLCPTESVFFWQSPQASPAAADDENHVLEQLEHRLKKQDVAGVVLEPIQGRGGKRSFSAFFLRQCKDLCLKYGSLLVFDEILTGFGRTGRLFALEHHGVLPDLLCLGKAMGGGLPLSACVGDILDVWGVSQGEARHTQTFLGHPLACAVGGATVRALVKKLPAFLNQLPCIDNAFNCFAAKMTGTGLEERFPYRVLGKGFMRGLWFYKAEEGFSAILAQKLLNEKVMILPEGTRGDVLSFIPPLIAQEADYRQVLNATIKTLQDLHND